MVANVTYQFTQYCYKMALYEPEMMNQSQFMAIVWIKLTSFMIYRKFSIFLGKVYPCCLTNLWLGSHLCSIFCPRYTFHYTIKSLKTWLVSQELSCFSPKTILIFVSAMKCVWRQVDDAHFEISKSNLTFWELSSNVQKLDYRFWEFDIAW